MAVMHFKIMLDLSRRFYSEDNSSQPRPFDGLFCSIKSPPAFVLCTCGVYISSRLLTAALKEGRKDERTDGGTARKGSCSFVSRVVVEHARGNSSRRGHGGRDDYSRRRSK